MNPAETSTAFAPASVANVAVGFDLLGFAFGEVGDHVSLRRLAAGKEPKLRMGKIESPFPLPEEIEKNCAGAALRAMLDDLGLPYGFEISLRKGIPIASGMGGSAASAVGAVVAANALLDEPLPKERLLEYALAGEAVASGEAHGDNVAACLYGGLTAVLPGRPFRVLELPLPREMHCLLVNPELQLNTKEQRASLAEDLPLSMHVQQSAHLAGFIAACYEGDLDLLAESMRDLVVGPQRSPSIPGYADLRSAAERQGALAFAIAGSGPSVFAWLRSTDQAEALRTSLLKILAAVGISAASWIAPLGAQAARIVESP